MYKRALCLAFALLLSMPTALAGSPRSMDFNGIRITLGQESNQALSRLHASFNLQPVSGRSGAYSVRTKEKSGQELGIITLRNGRIAQLERERGRVYDVGQGALISRLIRELIAEGNTQVELAIEKRLIAGVSHEIISLKAPGKRLDILVSNPPAGSGEVSFRELLD